MGRRFVQLKDGSMFEVPKDYSPAGPASATIQGDLPAYYSHATGQMVEGRVQRRQDLAVSGCRPFEGQAAEQKEADRARAYAAERREAAVEKQLQEILPHLSRDVRGALLHGDTSSEFNERSLRGRRA